MAEMLAVVSIACLLAAIIGALIALVIQRSSLQRIGAERQAWERTREAHQQDWEMRQEKRAAELEARLTRQVQQVQRAWKEWEANDQERIKSFTVRFEDTVAQLELEHELARLPHVEDIPLTPDATHSHQYTTANWRPPQLQATNLSDRDLSHRYLGLADLRNAQLSNANLYMADLSGALLTGANLANSDLSGANLAGADLRDATLTGANLLVADLYGAILVGAKLGGARNLTASQVNTAIYDSTTQLDLEIGIHKSPLLDPQPAIATSKPETTVMEKSTDTVVADTPASTGEQAFAATLETPLSIMPGEIEWFTSPQSEPPHSSPLPSDDSLLAPLATDLPGDRQENTQGEESNTTDPSSLRNGNKRARAI